MHVFPCTIYIFSGGGRLEIDVSQTLTVDGHIMANSEDVLYTNSWQKSSGGSGGSILIHTVNYTGTGFVTDNKKFFCFVYMAAKSCCHMIYSCPQHWPLHLQTCRLAQNHFYYGKAIF